MDRSLPVAVSFITLPKENLSILKSTLFPSLSEHHHLDVGPPGLLVLLLLFPKVPHLCNQINK